jgi:hypothetical protein
LNSPKKLLVPKELLETSGLLNGLGRCDGPWALIELSHALGLENHILVMDLDYLAWSAKVSRVVSLIWLS